MSNPLNKSSQYVQSLVDYIADTKPYHSKLTEIVEEYQFAETMRVKITEITSMPIMQKAAWRYDFFSGGNSTYRTMLGKQVLSPDFLRTYTNNTADGAFKAFRDENTDMGLVPFVFNKKQFDGLGIADGRIELNGTDIIPYTDGHDFFHNYGSLEFQVKRINDINGLNPAWTETNLDGIIATATLNTTALESDLSRPQSAVNKLIEFFTGIQQHITSPVYARPSDANWVDAVAACASLLTTLSTETPPGSQVGTIPNPYTIDNTGYVLVGEYERILYGASKALPAIPAPPNYQGWIGNDTGGSYVDEVLANLLPPLLFNAHNDINLYESGVLWYDDVSIPSLQVRNIIANPAATVYDEWTIRCVSSTPSLWEVSTTQAGIVGGFESGSNFSSPGFSFESVALATPNVGETLVLTPRNKISIHQSANLERWNVIKTDPISYTRPVFTSTRYGHIQNLSGSVGTIDLLDDTLPSGTVVLTATSPTTFSVTHTSDVLSGSATVGIAYSDKVGFVIVAGSVQSFVAGDRFLIEIVNGPAKPVDFDLYYGYDLDSYDNALLEYDVPAGQALDFKYDSRFTDYDLTLMLLTTTQAAHDGRVFRLMAEPTGAVINTVAPPGEPPLDASLTLHRSTSFRLEYSDNGFQTKTVVANVPVGGTFSDAALGISFTLPAASKAFISASSADSVTGGDVFSWRISNPPPAITSLPVGLMGATVPRLVMYGGSYWRSAPADWTITFSASSTYTITGYYTTGALYGTLVPGYTTPITLADGATYRDDNLHFTVKPGRGLGSGDTFTLSTLRQHPSFMVHGSVTGWTPNAEYGKWYWNGSIGFKIHPSIIRIFATSDTKQFKKVNVYWQRDPVPTGHIQEVFVRPDTPALVYTFARTTGRTTAPITAGGWMVSRSDMGVVGFVAYNGTFKDEYIELAITDVHEDFHVHAIPDTLDFWNAQDTVVVRSNFTVLNPTASDFVSFVKTEMGTLRLSLNYQGVQSVPDIASLYPIAIDTQFIDIDTHSSIALARTSPEVALLDTWLPTYLVKRDTATSVAEFPDATAYFDVRSAATGQLIGTLKPLNTVLQEPTVLEFDSGFFTTYLPLNAKAHLVTYGTGLDDNVSVNITERIAFLFSGDVLFENAMFKDSINVTIIDTEQLGATSFSAINDPLQGSNTILVPAAFNPLTNILNPGDGVFTPGSWRFRLTPSHDVTINTAVADGPFGGFMAGYDNLPYDAEDVIGIDSIMSQLSVDNAAQLQLMNAALIVAGLMNADNEDPLRLAITQPYYAQIQINADTAHAQITALVEAAQGAYDTGYPLVDQFFRAQYLATLGTPTTTEASELSVLTSQLQSYLQPAGLAATSLAQFLGALDSVGFATGGTAPGFGFPIVGHATDISQGETEPVSHASMSEAFSVQVADTAGTMDSFGGGFDSTPLDAYGERTALLFSMSLPPVPAGAIPPTWADFITPLEVSGVGARIFEVSFANPPVNMPTPTFKIWRPTDPVPLTVNIVQVVSNGRFRFSLPNLSEVKIVAT